MPPPRAPPPRRMQQQAPLRPRRGRAGMNGSLTHRSVALRSAASRIIRGSDLRNPSTMANRRAGYLTNRSNRDVLARRIKLAKIRRYVSMNYYQKHSNYSRQQKNISF
jgi:hypothetical protein